MNDIEKNDREYNTIYSYIVKIVALNTLILSFILLIFSSGTKEAYNESCYKYQNIDTNNTDCINGKFTSFGIFVIFFIVAYICLFLHNFQTVSVGLAGKIDVCTLSKEKEVYFFHILKISTMMSLLTLLTWQKLLWETNKEAVVHKYRDECVGIEYLMKNGDYHVFKNENEKINMITRKDVNENYAVSFSIYDRKEQRTIIFENILNYNKFYSEIEDLYNVKFVNGSIDKGKINDNIFIINNTKVVFRNHPNVVKICTDNPAMISMFNIFLPLWHEYNRCGKCLDECGNYFYCYDKCYYPECSAFNFT